MIRNLAFGGVFALSAIILQTPAHAQSPCGSQATVAAGETLADVAERCEVSLGALFDANPKLRSTDVAAGTKIEMPPPPAQSVLDRAGDALKSAGKTIEDAATKAGQSVSEYLSDNPDLNRNILEWGEQLGLPGVAPKPQVGADVTVSPNAGRPGDAVTIEASGLAGDTEVRIGAGPPKSEYKVIKSAQTDRAGRLETTLKVPQVADGQDTLIFVVETDRVRLTSKPFEIVPN